MRVSGHESFACRYAWLPKTLNAVVKSPNLFGDDDLAMVELGVGKNMVRSMRFWSEVSGMVTSTDRGYNLAPSELGKQIFGPRGLDRFLEDSTTLWLLHWKIATTPNPLLAWDFLLNRWQETEFSESRVLAAMAKELDAVNRSAKMNTLRQHLSIFLLTYLDSRMRRGEDGEDNLDCPLTDLDFVVKIGEREANDSDGKREPVYAFRREDKASISPGLFAYCVNDFWNRRHGGEMTLRAKSVAYDYGSPGQVFKIPEQEIYQRLSDLTTTTENRIIFNDSEALPQLSRPERVGEDFLLRQAYN
ncbi:MAG: DUF4007 family protein [Pseudomonadota bacterium]